MEHVGKAVYANTHDIMIVNFPKWYNIYRFDLHMLLKQSLVANV
jgi:hypothetical protein